MISLHEIKLIIWDLDDTLWKGTISENDIPSVKYEFIEFIKDCLDRGIVHSLCSKNDFDPVKAHLEDLGLWDLFVFPSVNWDSKGARIKNIITDMKLRAENVLFVDDNPSNLHEAEYYNPGLKICLPDEMIPVIGSLSEITGIDKSRPRLKHYRQLEQKVTSQLGFASNEEFLMSCNIRVNFHYDCIENIHRIHELIMRSNQLNYTKFRQSKDDLLAALSAPHTNAAYITVTDTFGDYGIVGFYMLSDNQLVHYLFSCRTLGMLVEQYVYMQLGCPPLDIVGNVATELNTIDTPRWINQQTGKDNSAVQKDSFGSKRILFKGPCDIQQIFSFIEETPSIKTELTYVNDKGVSIEGHNHSSQIITALTASNADKDSIISDVPWLDRPMLETSWHGNDAIVFSLLTDGNLGIYQHKKTGWKIALCEAHYDLTNPKNWEAYIQGSIFTSLIKFDRDMLCSFADQYCCIPNTDGEITMQNMDVLYNAKGRGTKLILILGSEIPFEGPIKPAYADRHIFHKILNDKIKLWAAGKPDVYLIELSRYIHSQKDYLDTINHFPKKVYYYIAKDILTILDAENSSLKLKNKGFLYWISFRKRAKTIIKKLLGRI